MTFEQLKDIVKDYKNIKIISKDNNKIEVEFTKEEETPDTLEALGYSFDVGM